MKFKWNVFHTIVFDFFCHFYPFSRYWSFQSITCTHDGHTQRTIKARHHHHPPFFAIGDEESGMLRKSLANKTCRNNSLSSFPLLMTLRRDNSPAPCTRKESPNDWQQRNRSRSQLIRTRNRPSEDSLAIPHKGRKSVPLHWWPLIMAINNIVEILRPPWILSALLWTTIKSNIVC